MSSALTAACFLPNSLPLRTRDETTSQGRSNGSKCPRWSAEFAHGCNVGSASHELGTVSTTRLSELAVIVQPQRRRGSNETYTLSAVCFTACGLGSLRTA